MFKALAYMMLGKRGESRMEKLIGLDSSMHDPDEDAETRARTEGMMAFIRLINANFVFHRGALPVLSDEQLNALRMPVLMFFGAQDALLNASASCKHLAANVPQADIRLLPEAGHVILRKTDEIGDFLAT